MQLFNDGRDRGQKYLVEKNNSCHTCVHCSLGECVDHELRMKTQMDATLHRGDGDGRHGDELLDGGTGN